MRAHQRKQRQARISAAVSTALYSHYADSNGACTINSLASLLNNSK
ncbi:hypothetical protein [Testudinibacter aquarius]|nr:hypothetical protein [Testudinibacter aquarius]